MSLGTAWIQLGKDWNKQTGRRFLQLDVHDLEEVRI